MYVAHFRNGYLKQNDFILSRLIIRPPTTLAIIYSVSWICWRIKLETQPMLALTEELRTMNLGWWCRQSLFCVPQGLGSAQCYVGQMCDIIYHVFIKLSVCQVQSVSFDTLFSNCLVYKAKTYVEILITVHSYASSKINHFEKELLESWALKYFLGILADTSYM